MIKHYCDICGRLMQPYSYCSEDDPDDYNYGSLEVDFGEWFLLDEICKGCAIKYHQITKDEVMELIRKKCCGSDAN